MKIGLLGGSFDPIHKAHLSLALAAQKQFQLDCVYFLLSPHSPFKSKQKRTSAALRAKMVRAAISKFSFFKFAAWEMKSRKPNYTVDTLRSVRKRFKRDELFFILGSDAFSTFEKWKSPQEILGFVTLLVGKRPSSPRIKIKKSWKPKVLVMKGLFPNIASHIIRENLKLNKQKLPAPVWSLIQKNKLYS